MNDEDSELEAVFTALLLCGVVILAIVVSAIFS